VLPHDLEELWNRLVSIPNGIDTHIHSLSFAILSLQTPVPETVYSSAVDAVEGTVVVFFATVTGESKIL
jgi:hypothetical protein